MAHLSRAANTSAVMASRLTAMLANRQPSRRTRRSRAARSGPDIAT